MREDLGSVHHRLEQCLDEDDRRYGIEHDGAGVPYEYDHDVNLRQPRACVDRRRECETAVIDNTRTLQGAGRTTISRAAGHAAPVLHCGGGRRRRRTSACSTFVL